MSLSLAGWQVGRKSNHEVEGSNDRYTQGQTGGHTDKQTVSVFSPVNFNDAGNVWMSLVPFGEGLYIPQVDLGQRNKETRGAVRDTCRLQSAWHPTLPCRGAATAWFPPSTMYTPSLVASLTWYPTRKEF